MNFFEQELRNLMSQGIAPKSSRTSFVGRSCYTTLSGSRMARLEFVTTVTADSYTALTITILDSNQGAIDTQRLRFKDHFALTKDTFGNRIAPYIWVYRDPEWYRSPTAADLKNLATAAKEYISLFA